MTLFKTATFPFIIPFRLRVMTSVQKLLLNPKATAEMDDPMHPCASVTSGLQHRGATHQDQDWFPADAVRQCPPMEDRQQLGY